MTDARSMDRQRDPAILRRKRRLRWLAGAVLAASVVATSVAVSRLEPALPSVLEGTLWFGTVKRGPLVREVRGSGVLVPEAIRWVTATTSGRVERIVIQPGARVEPGTLILELSNPDARQAVRTAELDLATAKAQLANQRATIANTRLTQQANLVDAEAAHQLAVTDLDMHRMLAAKGMVAVFALRQKEAAMEQAKNRLDLVKRQLASAEANESLQLAPAEAAVNQRQAELERVSRQLADLQVRSTMTGLLQAVGVEVGQQVGPGLNLARVSDPTRLKAEVRIAETQTRDLASVDVTLEGPLPAGARPDLGVDATIELERLANVLFVESPAIGQEQSTITLFKVLPDREARRTPVKVGRRSVRFVEVVDGLVEGDRVILSDMSQYDAFDRLRVK
jgi:HlyD family secretion protein